MTIKRILFKPRWQHKDAAVRAAAVATEDDPQLLGALREICLHDPEPEVRSAAIRRVDHLPTLMQAAGRAAEPAEQQLIATRLRALTASRGDDRPPLSDRLAAVEASADRALLETVALQAPEADLRRAALEKVARQGVLGDVAIGDPDPAIRRLAADRISQQSTLQRVIDRVRKSDKALHQDLQARLHRQRLAAGDPEAVSQEARSICERLEALATKPGPASGDEFEELGRAWAEVADLAGHELIQRHAAVAARLSQPAPAARPREAPEPRQPASGKKPAAEHPDGDASEPASPAEPGVPAPSPPPETASSELLALLESKVRQFIEQVEAGELHRALQTRAELLEGGKPLGGSKRWQQLQRDMNTVSGRLRELRDWHHWSNNKIRKRLIREMVALPGSGLHPDAVLQKLKELQAEWKELEQSEQIPGDKHFSAPPWMWRKFNQAGRAAFELTKPFLDKRTEVQRSHLQEMRALSRQLETLGQAAEPDWLEVRKAVSAASRSLRSLGEIPARKRKSMAAELRDSMEAANARLQEHYGEVEKAKRRLIRSAAQLEHVTDRDEAIDRAKSLQAEWKSAGSLWRSREQKLWEEFRRPIDPLFEAVKTEREAERAAHRQELAAQKELCSALKEILELEDSELAASRGRVLGLEEAWQDAGAPDATLRREFQRLQNEFERRIRRHERSLAEATRQRWWLKADLLHQLETAVAAGEADAPSAEKIRASWPGEADTRDAIDTALETRFRGASQVASLPESIDHGRLLCIRLEFLAGLRSPDEEQELRMSYQVERLSASMTGDAKRLPAREEAQQAEQEWLCIAYIPDPEHAAFRARIRKALREIYSEK